MEPLSPEQARVVACLVEKQRTVPDTYPLTLNGLIGACNQSSNRDPVVFYDEHTVLAAIDDLKARGLARVVHPPAGTRATKFRHVLDEALELDGGELALMTVLLLRGPQTVAELRTRTERMHGFADQADLEATLERLASRDEPLVRRLERRPGEREVRWMDLISERAAASGRDETSSERQIATRTEQVDRIAELEARVAELEAVVAELKGLLD